jgi:putative nucleotidyltransferase with HDIG domain
MVQHIKKISTVQLKRGMFVHKFCAPWWQHPFWRSNFLITSNTEIDKILDSGVTDIIIDTTKGADVSAPSTVKPMEQSETSKISDASTEVPMELELNRAIAVYDQSKQAIRSMFDDIRMGKSVTVETATSMVSAISESVMSNSSALISIVRLKTANEYTYMHSVAVCALMIGLAKACGYDKEACKEVGLAGLLHDIGKVMIPNAVINKAGPLTEEEHLVMRTHPERGHQILKNQYQVSDAVLDVCLHHHERIDGQGYPHGLVGDQINQLTKIASICDVYDAITSTRPYKSGWNPSKALKEMAQWTGQFDTKLFQTFVKMIGIYPVGSFVRLQSKKMGVVLEQNKNSLLTPRVKVFYSASSHSFISEEIIDLSVDEANDSIVGPENPADWNIYNIEKYWAVSTH